MRLMLRFFITLFLCSSLAANPAYFDQLANSIYLAEGGSATKYPFGVLSVKPKDFHDARQICINTISNNYAKWEKLGSKDEFIDYLARTYAPTSGVKPKVAKLNANWPKNVKFFMSKGLTNWSDVIAYENVRKQQQ